MSLDCHVRAPASGVHCLFDLQRRRGWGWSRLFHRHRKPRRCRLWFPGRYLLGHGWRFLLRQSNGERDDHGLGNPLIMKSFLLLLATVASAWAADISYFKSISVQSNAYFGSLSPSKLVGTDGSTNLVSSGIPFPSSTNLTVPGNLSVGGTIAGQVTLTHAGTVTLSFAPLLTESDLTLTGAVTFATSGLAAGKSYTVFGRNTQATNCTPTFPSWRWMGGAPATITAGKEFVLGLASRGTVDTNVWAVYSEVP